MAKPLKKDPLLHYKAHIAAWQINTVDHNETLLLHLH